MAQANAARPAASPGQIPAPASPPAPAARQDAGRQWVALLDAAKAAEAKRRLASSRAPSGSSEAAPGQGWSPGPATVQDRADAPSHGPLPAPRPGGPATRRVLLIESDARHARELSRALEARGLSALVASDGSEGIDLARRERPDVIVLCAELSDVSGYAVCGRLKKDRLLASVPIVITSAAATPRTFAEHRRLSVRAEAYLSKPFDPAELLGAIAEVAAPPWESLALPPLDLAAIERVAQPRPPAGNDEQEEPEEELDPAAGGDGLGGGLLPLGVDERDWLDTQFEKLAAGETAAAPFRREEARGPAAAGKAASWRPPGRA